MEGDESALFRTGITPIRTIQFVQFPSTDDTSPLYNEIVTIRGRVTALDGANYYYIQDDDGGAWDGIYVRVAKLSPLQFGRLVNVTGRVNEYFGQTYISFASGHNHFVDAGYSQNVNTNLVTASDIPYRDDPDTSEPYEDCLVRMESARLDSLDGVPGPVFAEWLLFQAGDPDTAQMDYNEINFETDWAACIDDVVNVNGILVEAFNEYTIWPEWGRGVDIEVIFDNPACAPTAVDEAATLLGAPNLRSEPNPFNPRTTLRFRLPSADRVRLEITDPAGRIVRTLLDGEELTAGPQSVVWDGKDDRGHRVATGTYFAHLLSSHGFTAKKMVLLK
jgi:hypothetical protein